MKLVHELARYILNTNPLKCHFFRILKPRENEYRYVTDMNMLIAKLPKGFYYDSEMSCIIGEEDNLRIKIIKTQE